MRTTREEVIRAFEQALGYVSEDQKVECLRYYIEGHDGTFRLPLHISVITADKESPDELLRRLIRELNDQTEREEAELEEFIARGLIGD